MAAKALDFRGRLSFPIAPEESAGFNPQKLPLLFGLNESGFGGWYPIGAAQTWHNGIHLAVSAGTPVRSMARGTIVAARIVKPSSKGKFEFGTPSFVLIKHAMTILENPAESDFNNWETRDVEFYSLYMHIDISAEHSATIPWLRSFVPFLEENTCSGDTLARINVAEDGPDKKTKIGLNCRTAPVKHGNRLVPGTLIRVIPQGTIVEVSNKEEDEWKSVNVPSMRLTDVWVYSGGNRLAEVKDFEDQLNAFQEGGCAKFNYPVESGEIVGHAGLIRPAQLSRFEFSDIEGLHLEVFSAKNVIGQPDMKQWTLVEDDTGDDVLCEFEPLTKKINRPSVLSKLGWDTTDFVTLDEIHSYFKTLADADKTWLRGLITHNTSYWSIDWSEMAKSNEAWAKEFDFTDADAQVADRYMWWEECEKKGVDLPPRDGGKALVYHYHPLSLMKYLHEHLPPVPLFYVKRGDQEFVVARPDDIEIATHEKVWVYEADAPDWLLGRGYSYGANQGIGYSSDKTLYAMLIKPAGLPGIPALDASSRHIWASLWHSEGSLEAINTYDSAFLSFGPIQQTAGPGADEGELEGAFYHVKTANAALYQKLLGAFKLDVASVTGGGGIDTGYFTLDGKVLKSQADKAVLRDFIWAYRCVKAMQNETFRRLFLEHGFKRISVLKGLTAKVGGKEVKLGDIYKMELSLALLLDAHINLTSLVASSDGIWAKAAKSALGLGANDPVNMGTITRDQEYAMIAKIIQLRNQSGMTDKVMRAAYIVLCAKDLDDALAKKFGYDSVEDIKTGTGLSPTKIADQYMYGFLEHSR